SHASAATHAATASTTSAAFIAVTPGIASSARGAGWSLCRNGYVRGDGIQAQDTADEVPEGHHQLGRMDGAAFGQFGGGAGRQLYLFFGSQQNNVRQCRFDRIANAARAV